MSKIWQNWGFSPPEGDRINRSRRNLARISVCTPNFALIGKMGSVQKPPKYQNLPKCGFWPPEADTINTFRWNLACKRSSSLSLSFLFSSLPALLSLFLSSQKVAIWAACDKQTWLMFACRTLRQSRSVRLWSRTLRLCRASESRVKVARQNRRCDMALSHPLSQLTIKLYIDLMLNPILSYWTADESAHCHYFATGNRN